MKGITREMRTIKAGILVSGVAAAGLTLAMMAGPAIAGTHGSNGHGDNDTASATSQVKGDPDSGANGNDWGYDKYRLRASVHLMGSAPLADCPGSLTGACYLWHYTLDYQGTTTTRPGQLSPREPVVLHEIDTGTMTGGTNDGQFWSDWRTATARPPAYLNDNNTDPTGRDTNTNWPEQFFGATAVFNSAANPGGPDLGPDAGWTYTFGFGTDRRCPHDAYQWVDSAAGNWGTLISDGGVLSPDSPQCT
jgi:hypothetical protein